MEYENSNFPKRKIDNSIRLHIENNEPNKIEWDKLYKERTVTIYPKPIYEKKQLPEGVYLCPKCLGDGKVISVHRMFGEHEYTECQMCQGICEIRKCETCDINPVPNYPLHIECLGCREKTSKKFRDEFLKRVKKDMVTNTLNELNNQ